MAIVMMQLQYPVTESEEINSDPKILFDTNLK